ncbi:MAG: InlB B-repeat-containing protein, partial [Bacilli bacterium]|nr:InlB B-repeat-containing protein [Bacilli bacterium]
MKKKQRFMLKTLFFGALSLSALIGLSPKAAAVYAEDGPVTVDLSTLTNHYVALDGDILTGTLTSDKHYKVSIAEGATVTLQDASITTINDSSYDWDGITLLGDANIILKGANTIKSNRTYRSGIFVPENKTVTIDGDGSLNVTSSGNAIGASSKKTGGNVTIKGGTIVARAGQSHAAIGGGYNKAPVGNITIEGGDITAYGGNYSPGIGCGETNYCGNITITGGTVRATGGDKAAGIGIGKHYQEYGGDITITGGTVIAQGGILAAGIGSGGEGNSKVGDITITDTVDEVVAKKGGIQNGHQAINSIGAGYSGSNDLKARFGTVTVLGTVYPEGVKDDTFAFPTFHKVTLNTDGGTIQEGDLTRYKEGAVTTLPTNVTKDFYTFKGWYNNENF